MAGVGFLQSLWERPIWEGGWRFGDPIDNVLCVYAQHPWSGCCAREVRAAWRALYLHDSEGAGSEAGQ